MAQKERLERQSLHMRVPGQGRRAKKGLQKAQLDLQMDNDEEFSHLVSSGRKKMREEGIGCKLVFGVFPMLVHCIEVFYWCGRRLALGVFLAYGRVMVELSGSKYTHSTL